MKFLAVSIAAIFLSASASTAETTKQSMVLHLWGQMPGDGLQPASLPLEHGTNRPVTVLLIACAGIANRD
jgi:hypothetical protein